MSSDRRTQRRAEKAAQAAAQRAFSTDAASLLAQEAILEQSRSLQALRPKTEKTHEVCLKKLKEYFKTALELPDWEDFFREYGSELPANPITLGRWKGFARWYAGQAVGHPGPLGASSSAASLPPISVRTAVSFTHSALSAHLRHTGTRTIDAAQFTQLTTYITTDLAQELGLTTAARHKPVATAVDMRAVLMQVYDPAYNWSSLAQRYSFTGMLKIMTFSASRPGELLLSESDCEGLCWRDVELIRRASQDQDGTSRFDLMARIKFHNLKGKTNNGSGAYKANVFVWDTREPIMRAAMGHNACSAAYRAYHAKTAQIDVQGLVAHGSENRERLRLPLLKHFNLPSAVSTIGRQEVFGAADVKHLQEAVRHAQATFKSSHADLSIRQGKQLGLALAKAVKSAENDLSQLISARLLAQWRKEVAAAVESENLRAFAPRIAELATAAAFQSTADGILLDTPSGNGVDVLLSLGNADLRDPAVLRANAEEELEVDLDLGLDVASIQAQPTAPRTHLDEEPNISLVPPTRFALAHANHAHMQATLKGGRDLESGQYLALLRLMLNEEMLHSLPLARATPSAKASAIPALEAMKVFMQCPLPEGKYRKTSWQGCGNVSGDDVAELVWHLGTQHANLAKGTPCRLCSKRFGSANDGYCHYEAEHNVVFANAAHRKLTQPPAIEEIVASITHRSELCHETLPGRAALLYHCMAHHDEFKHRGVPLPLPGASADLAKAGVCPICVKSDLPAVNAVTTFSRMQSLSEHFQTVHIHKDMEKPFVQEHCPYPTCATRCGTYVDLINHLVEEHGIAIFGMQEKQRQVWDGTAGMLYHVHRAEKRPSKAKEGSTSKRAKKVASSTEGETTALADKTNKAGPSRS
ncbi:Zinc finger, C2H2-like [Ceraceosorus bombacis]|uniref:Zinc finger, C2H2-like n=1 Tax=Ceraceosorus bombacis TaxID=401625 RepID=A0A0P1B7Q0_9BASI|nr:Zinc finger, C2H2-like [Ceraceosorus bombacis]